MFTLNRSLFRQISIVRSTVLEKLNGNNKILMKLLDFLASK